MKFDIDEAVKKVKAEKKAKFESKVRKEYPDYKNKKKYDKVVLFPNLKGKERKRAIRRMFLKLGILDK